MMIFDINLPLPPLGFHVSIALTNTNDPGSHSLDVVDGVQGGVASDGGGDEDHVVGHVGPVTQATDNVCLHPPYGTHRHRVLVTWSEKAYSTVSTSLFYLSSALQSAPVCPSCLLLCSQHQSVLVVFCSVHQSVLVCPSCHQSVLVVFCSAVSTSLS